MSAVGTAHLTAFSYYNSRYIRFHHMKNHLLLSVMGLWLALAGCNNKPAVVQTTHSADSVSLTPADTAYIPESDTFSTLDEYADMYLVVVDTGSNYWQLEHTMFTLNSKLGLKIDTMGRYYNAGKNDVVLPDDDEDDIYAGSYFPRRYGDDFLSIENISYYRPGLQTGAANTFLLISGLYDNPSSADSMAGIIKPYQPTVFVMKSKIYMGCMH